MSTKQRSNGTSVGEDYRLERMTAAYLAEFGPGRNATDAALAFGYDRDGYSPETDVVTMATRLGIAPWLPFVLPVPDGMTWQEYAEAHLAQSYADRMTDASGVLMSERVTERKPNTYSRTLSPFHLAYYDEDGMARQTAYVAGPVTTTRSDGTSETVPAQPISRRGRVEGRPRKHASNAARMAKIRAEKRAAIVPVPVTPKATKTAAELRQLAGKANSSKDLNDVR